MNQLLLGLGLSRTPPCGGDGGTGPGVGVDNLLLESGDNLLLESGDAVLME